MTWVVSLPTYIINYRLYGLGPCALPGKAAQCHAPLLLHPTEADIHLPTHLKHSITLDIINKPQAGLRLQDAFTFFVCVVTREFTFKIPLAAGRLKKYFQPMYHFGQMFPSNTFGIRCYLLSDDVSQCRLLTANLENDCATAFGEMELDR